MKARIACVQFQSKPADRNANIESIKKWTIKAKSKIAGLDLIIFPELTITGYECGEKYFDMAEGYPNGDYIRLVGEIAKENNVSIIFGFVEREIQGEKTVLFNTAVLMGNQGYPLGKYQKVHLVQGMETGIFTRGVQCPVFDTPFGRIGIMICWDSAFPEVSRILALKGAQIIAVPAAWEAPMDNDWDLVLSARSFDNVIYVAASNWVGTDDKLDYFGKSKIVGPLGNVRSSLGSKEGMIWEELDLDELERHRNGYYTQIYDRQIKTYKGFL